MSEPLLTEKEFNQFRDLIRHLAGISMGPTKRELVQSRLQRRLRHHSLKSFSDYFAMVTHAACPPDEIEALVNCVTTNTTSFFRERHHFEFVKEQAVPALLQSVRDAEQRSDLRIWHAGCSTGEEPYTLAITLNDTRENSRIPFTFRQLASDIDTNVLATAERGVYDEEKLKDVPENARRSSFLRGKGDRSDQYKIKSHLRAQITFRQINLLDDQWPFRQDTKFDMIWCRNVVIYFDKPTQQKLFARFAQMLNPWGYMFIGHSESLLGISTSFSSVGQTIYQPGEKAQVRAA